MKRHFRLSSEIYGFFEKLFHPWQEFLKRQSVRRRFYIFGVSVQGIFRSRTQLNFPAFLFKKMLFSQNGERPSAQSLLICSNDNIMQIKDLNQR